MPRPVLAPRGLLFGLLALLALPARPAPAQDAAPAAPAPPRPRAKIAHPYLDSLVGSWDVAVDVGGVNLRGRSRWSRILDGTALAEEFTVGEGPSQFFGLGVLYVGEKGDTVTHWWFDSEGRGGVQRTSGPLKADGYATKGTFGDVTLANSLTKTADGHLFVMASGTGPQVRATYTRSASEHAAPPVLEERRVKRPVVDALLGAWKVRGAYTAGGHTLPHEGTSTFRHVVGGAYLLQEYTATSAAESSWAFGVASLAPDGATGRSWSFTNYFAEPQHFRWTLTDDAIAAEGEPGPMGVVRVSLRTSPQGLDVTCDADGLAGREAYTRP